MSTIQHGHAEPPGSPRANDVHSFTLALSASAITTELEDALYAPNRCDDALLHSRDGRVYLDFDRAAENAQEAIMSAIRDVESVPGLTVIEVLPVGADAIDLANAFLKVRTNPTWKKLL